MPNPMSIRGWCGVVAAAMFAAACADAGTTAPTVPAKPNGYILYSPPGPAYGTRVTRYADWELVEVCTDAAGTADFHASHQESSPPSLQTLDFSLAAGGCRDVALTSLGDGAFYVDETAAPLGYKFDSLVVNRVSSFQGVQSRVGVFTTDDYTINPADNTGGWLIEYYHSPVAGGCTYTLGYWKTHSENGPAPYDDTWAQLSSGASTAFFLSGQSYYQVFQTAPAGNAYYQLAHQWMAAQLNMLNGASVPSNVASAFTTAQSLFGSYTPAQIGALKGSNGLRQQFISLAGTLGSYNEGLIGPGHCGG
ncbi:MAG TPA: hypothetical protein VFS44_11450 [Gemmatimonadaceae bacterium]|nr:hypothetical protein [Gemmatimonadaceae bacterium]